MTSFTNLSAFLLAGSLSVFLFCETITSEQSFVMASVKILVTAVAFLSLAQLYQTLRFLMVLDEMKKGNVTNDEAMMAMKRFWLWPVRKAFHDER